jgi:transposase
MELLYARCAGLDVHRDSITACLFTCPPGKARPLKEVRTFSTFPDDLVKLADWLRSCQVEAIAMEGTGVYWMPVHAALETVGEVIVANAHHVKNVPGRKTDVADCQWLAQLCAHGLLAPSFVPPADIRDLRSLTREQTQLARQRATLINRIHKRLDQQGNKLGSVVSDLQGTTGREILRRLAAGETDLEAMAQCARTSLRRRLDDLRRALATPLSEVARHQLQRQLALWDLLDAQLDELAKELALHVAPHQQARDKLVEIPGVGEATATKILAEIGVDMSRFATPGRLASWAGVCPGNHESAGQQKAGRRRRGNVHLVTTLVEAALAATRAKGTYLKAKYHRLKSRLGGKKALVALAHTLLTIIWHVLREPEARYRERGDGPVDERQRARQTESLRKRLEALGHEVTLRPRTTEVSASA